MFILRQLKRIGLALFLTTIFALLEASAGGGFGQWEEWVGTTLVAWLLITVWQRVARFVRGPDQRFPWWPEVFFVLGVALLAFGASGLFSPRAEDADRYLFTLGVATAVVARLVRQRRHHGS